MATEFTPLPGFLVADLYRSSLVLVEETVHFDPHPGTNTTAAVAEAKAASVPAEPVAPAAKTVAAVTQPNETIVAAPSQPPVLTGEWYLGANQRKITIVVNEPEARYLKDDSFQFLSAILGACKLNMGDVAIVNHAHNPVNYAQLKEKLSPASLLLFNVSARQVHLPFMVPFYQVQKYDNCQVLLAPTLEAMLGTGQDAKLEKSKLWLCLKKMFGI